LVGVEDLGRAKARQRFFQGLDAEVGRHRVGQPVRQDFAREQVELVPEKWTPRSLVV
jgi:hypothetical protein